MLETEVGTAWSRTTAPTLSVLDLESLKEHLRVTDFESDSVLESYLKSATEEAEQYLGRGLLTQTWTLLLSQWADVMPLPMAAPLASVTSVKYYDTSGVQQTLATSVYDTDLVSRPGCVVLKPSQSWPSLQSTRLNGRIEIVYVVGWTTADLVPERIKQGIRQFVAYLDLDRAGMEARALEARQAAERCWSDRIHWLAPRC